MLYDGYLHSEKAVLIGSRDLTYFVAVNGSPRIRSIVVTGGISVPGGPRAKNVGTF